MAFKVVIDPTSPHTDELGRPIIIPPDGWEHEDMINIPGQMPGFEATPVKPPAQQVHPVSSPISQSMQPSQVPPPVTDTPVQPSQGPLIQPSAPTSLDTEIEQSRASMPTPDQFHESRGKRILEAIIAGAAGAAGGPKAGIEVAHELSPYRRALEVWENKQKALGLGVEREKTRFERGKEEAAAQSRKEGLLLEQMGIKSKDARDRYSQILEERRLLMDQKKEDSAEYWKNIESQLHLLDIEKPDADERAFALFQANPELFKKFEAAKRVGTAADLDTWVAKQRLAQDFALEKARKEATDPTIRAGKVATARAEQQAKGEPTDTEKQLANDAFDQLQKGADFNTIIKNLPSRVKGALVNRYAQASLTMPKQLNPKEQGLDDGARTTIGHLNSIQEMFNDPDIRENIIGPLAGLETKAGQLVGIIPGLTPEQERKASQLMTLINQTDAWEASTLGGGRPAFRFIEYLKRFLPDIQKDPSLFQGAIDGAMISEGNLIKSIRGSGVPGPGEVKHGAVVLDK